MGPLRNRLATYHDRARQPCDRVQGWDWTRAWWRHYGGASGRWRRLWVLEFRDGPDVVGYAGLFVSAGFAPLRIARMIGTGGSDYNDLVATPGHEARVKDAFWAYLAERRDRWDWLDLQQVRPDAALLAGNEGDGRAALGPVRVRHWAGETCPFLPLPPGDWEAFRKLLGKKMRGNIGYYDRALAKVYEVEHRLADNDTLADDLDAFFILHQRRWNRRWLPGAFAARRARAFHADVAERLLASGHLRLHTLSLDGETHAALYCFQFNNRCAYYLGGFEPTLARLSLGTVLTARAIRHAIEQDNCSEFDFLRGDEPYKYKWGARDRFNTRLSVTHGGLRGPALATAGRGALAAELALKRWMHQRHGGGSPSSPAPTSAAPPPGAPAATPQQQEKETSTV
jgi:CelD/BcsL family acetyltransferase involved in cellulose biosynthesis